MSFNFFKNFKIKVLFFIFLIFSFLNISLIPVFALITYGGGGTNQLSFNPNDYEIDYSQRHNSKFWRHEDGHVFASNARMFYDFPGMKMVPCRTYQEYANKTQIASTAINIGLNFFPPAKLFKVIKTGYQIAKEYGGDKICDF